MSMAQALQSHDSGFINAWYILEWVSETEQLFFLKLKKTNIKTWSVPFSPECCLDATNKRKAICVFLSCEFPS